MKYLLATSCQSLLWTLVLVLGWSLPWSSYAQTEDRSSPVPGETKRIFPEARITVYWQNSDTNTQALKSSSGVTLKNKRHVAVDPKLIPYGSEVRIEGWGTFIAVDTGAAVKKRTAARRMGKNVPVVDVFFLCKEEALRAARDKPAFSKIEIFPARS